jgi:hypothetical protein
MSRVPLSASKRHRILLPAAYGIHHKINIDLKRFFGEKLGHSTFFFYEFFLENPFTKWDADMFDSFRTITTPFLSRVVYDTGFIPALNVETVRKLKKLEEIEVVPLTQEAFHLYWSDLASMKLRVNDAETLKSLVQAWSGSKNPDYPEYFKQHTLRLEGGVVTLTGTLDTKDLREEYFGRIIAPLKATRLSADEIQKRTEIALAKLREYELVLRPWLRSPKMKEIGIVSASISSGAVFWGECFVVCPFSGGKGTSPKWLTDLEDLIRRRIQDIYSPMLAFLENYIYEDELQTKLKGLNIDEKKRSIRVSQKYWGITSNWIKRNSGSLSKIGSGKQELKDLKIRLSSIPEVKDHVYLSLLFHGTQKPEIWKRDLSKLERALVELWSDRFGVISKDTFAVKESLVFAKYLIASPIMVDRTRQAVELHHMAEDEKTGKKRSVKTALVVGGPGSGKDSMAQLIRLFSPGYRFGSMKALNMAMFRPKEAAVPLLLGLEAKLGETSFSVEGILHRSIVEAKNHNSKWGMTFILDELNSLDMDTQGALLRLLENAELTALGGMNPASDKMDLLVVGVMNEDPQMIMKRRLMEKVLREKQIFSGILGEALYEMFRNQRRLRDDLYYRLIRGGEIYLPELKDRREDIPILFYFIIKTDLLLLMPDSCRNSWEIELPVYEALMDPSLEWEGNLRELQTAARHIVALAVKDFEKQSNGKSLVIRSAHARVVLEKHRNQRLAEEYEGRSE